jgi:hypothetical protein
MKSKKSEKESKNHVNCLNSLEGNPLAASFTSKLDSIHSCLSSIVQESDKMTQFIYFVFNEESRFVYQAAEDSWVDSGKRSLG